MSDFNAYAYRDPAVALFMEDELNRQKQLDPRAQRIMSNQRLSGYNPGPNMNAVRLDEPLAQSFSLLDSLVDGVNNLLGPVKPGKGVAPLSKDAIGQWFGQEPFVGPPEPGPDDLFGDGSRDSKGRLVTPGQSLDHGATYGHHDQKKVKPMEWMRFETTPKPQENLAIDMPPPPKKAGADVSKTGTATNPTANMDDDVDLGDMEKLIKDFENKKGKLDLSPLIALTDSWTGSRLQAGYDAPMSDEERDAITMKLKGDLYQQKADQKYKKAYLTQQTEATKARLMFEAGEAEKDRQSREKIAGLRTAGKGSGNTEKVYLQLMNNPTFKKGLEYSARLQTGTAGDADDKSWIMQMGSTHNRVFKAAQIYSETTGVPLAQAYQMALEDEIAENRSQFGGE